MRLSLISAKSENSVIGNGPDIPWAAKGEQLLFKALTFNQWLLVGRKTFESMGVLPNRKYAVISRTGISNVPEGAMLYSSVESALEELKKITDQVFVAGGGQIYKSLISKVDTIHLSTVHIEVTGNVYFPEIPKSYELVYEQYFKSNIDYTYQVWRKTI